MAEDHGPRLKNFFNTTPGASFLSLLYLTKMTCNFRGSTESSYAQRWLLLALSYSPMFSTKWHWTVQEILSLRRKDAIGGRNINFKQVQLFFSAFLELRQFHSESIVPSILSHKSTREAWMSCRSLAIIGLISSLRLLCMLPTSSEKRNFEALCILEGLRIYSLESLALFVRFNLGLRGSSVVRRTDTGLFCGDNTTPPDYCNRWFCLLTNISTPF